MKLYTFIVERAGGTYCSQHAGEDYADAAHRFVDYAMSCEYLNIGSPIRERLLEDMLSAVAMDGLVNAYSRSHLDEADESWFITIVETVPSTTDGSAA
ncbi:MULTISPECIES: hypothetical protein [unclassified Roseovarius]|uniref:hypothetical protein n=1 Tax=unclassified Roseovarius TaxID=2614913 RepID=UPI00273EB383|nr:MULTISPECIES: hypothetical protein [unclassified Roseovarius]